MKQRQIAFNKRIITCVIAVMTVLITTVLLYYSARGSENAFQGVNIYFTDEYGNRHEGGYFKSNQTAIMHLEGLESCEIPSFRDPDFTKKTYYALYSKYTFKGKEYSKFNDISKLSTIDPETNQETVHATLINYRGSIGLAKNAPDKDVGGFYSYGNQYVTLINSGDISLYKADKYVPITTADGRVLKDAWIKDKATKFSENKYVFGLQIVSLNDQYPDKGINSVEISPYVLSGYMEYNLHIDDNAPRVRVEKVQNLASNNHCASYTIRISEAEDDGVGIGDMAYSCTSTGNAAYCNDTVFEITENGYYTVKVRDKLGNEYTENINITNIDKEAPVIDSASSILRDPANGYSKSAIINVNARDEGVGNLKYAYGKGNLSDDSGFTYSSNNTCVVNDNGIYTVFVKDAIGYKTRTTVTVTNIDNEGPLYSDCEIFIEPESRGYGSSVKVKPVISDICLLAERPYDYGSGFVSEDYHVYSKNGRYTIRYMDALGNISSQEINISCIDEVPPGIRGVEDITEGKINGYSLKKFVKVVAYDDESGLNPKAYSLDGGENYQSENCFEIADNGSYTVRVRDVFGNYSDYEFQVDMLDHTGPEISAGVEPLHAQNGYSLSANIIFDAEDDESGVGVDAYSFDGGNTFSSVNYKTIYDNEPVEVVIRDALGNISRFSHQADCIDRNPPQMQISAELPDNKINTSLKLKLNVVDNMSGVYAVYYNQVDTAEKILVGKLSGAEAMELEQIVYDNGEYSFYVSDLLGNEAVYTYIVDSFDRNGPIIDMISDITEDTVNGYSLQRKIRVTAHDEDSDLAGEAYSFDGGNTYSDKDYFVTDENTNLKICVKDSLGNVTVENFEVRGIDREAPDIKEIRKITPENTNGYGKEISITVDAYDEESGIEGAAYSFDGGVTFTDNNEYKVSDNRIIDIAVRDQLGNSRKVSFEVTDIDRISPELSISKKASDNNQSYFIELHMEDTMSGLDSIFYKALDMPERECLGSLDGAVKAETVIPVNENGVYAFWLYDRLGNETYREYVNDLKDDKGPVIGEIKDVSKDKVKGYARAVSILVSAVDGESLMATDAYSVDGGKSWFSNNLLQFYEDGEYTLMARDCYGNVSEKNFTVSRIDREAPVIEAVRLVSELEANGYIKEGNLRVVAHDDKVGLAEKPYSFNGGLDYTDSNSLKITKDEVVRLCVRDALGNESEEQITVDCIDREGPSVTISGNPLYKVTGDVILQLNVRDYKAGLASLWYMSSELPHKTKICSFSGESRSLQQVIIPDNGYYTFYVYDLLGNETVENVNVTMIEKEKNTENDKNKEDSFGENIIYVPSNGSTSNGGTSNGGTSNGSTSNGSTSNGGTLNGGTTSGSTNSGSSGSGAGTGSGSTGGSSSGSGSGSTGGSGTGTGSGSTGGTGSGTTSGSVNKGSSSSSKYTGSSAGANSGAGSGSTGGGTGSGSTGGSGTGTGSGSTSGSGSTGTGSGSTGGGGTGTGSGSTGGTGSGTTSGSVNKGSSSSSKNTGSSTGVNSGTGSGSGSTGGANSGSGTGSSSTGGTTGGNGSGTGSSSTGGATGGNGSGTTAGTVNKSSSSSSKRSSSSSVKVLIPTMNVVNNPANNSITNNKSSSSEKNTSVNGTVNKSSSSRFTGITVNGDNQINGGGGESNGTVIIGGTSSSSKKSSSSSSKSVIIVKDFESASASRLTAQAETDDEKHEGALITEFVGLSEDRVRTDGSELDEDEFAESESIFSELFGNGGSDVDGLNMGNLNMDDLNMERISGELDEALSGGDDTEVEYYTEKTEAEKENGVSPVIIIIGIIGVILLLTAFALLVLSKMGVINLTELLARLPFRKTAIENSDINEVTDELSDDI